LDHDNGIASCINFILCVLLYSISVLFVASCPFGVPFHLIHQF
jgi:hypothetical protein